jgi:hypothetical protein
VPKSSGNLGKFAAILRASSRLNNSLPSDGSVYDKT